MAERFASVSEDELCQLRRKIPQTQKMQRRQEKNLDEPDHDDKVTLANVLKRFCAEARENK